MGALEHQLTEGELEGVTGYSHEGTHPGAPEGEGDGEEPVVWRGERTVDEIIADLRQIQQQQINMLDLHFTFWDVRYSELGFTKKRTYRLLRLEWLTNP